MANKIQIRRGNKANLPTLSAGEPAFCTDTKQLFIGTGSGNIEYAKQSDVNIINSQLNEMANEVNQLSNPNLLINGDFQVWQRGTSFNANGVYTADRWQTACAGDSNISVSQSTTVPPNGLSKYSLRIEQYSVVGGFNYYTDIKQPLEDNLISILTGKTLTFSCWIKKDIADMTLQGIFGVTANTTEWQKIENTFIYDGSALFGRLVRTGLQAGQGFNLAQCKLEISSHATPFKPRLYAEELALCQRYYENIEHFRCDTVSNSAGVVTISVPYKVTKRIAPTITTSDEIYETGVITKDIIVRINLLQLNLNGNVGIRFAYQSSFIVDAEIY